MNGDRTCEPLRSCEMCGKRFRQDEPGVCSVKCGEKQEQAMLEEQAKEIAAEIENNCETYFGTDNLERFRAEQRRLWDKAEELGLTKLVTARVYFAALATR